MSDSENDSGEFSPSPEVSDVEKPVATEPSSAPAAENTDDTPAPESSDEFASTIPDEQFDEMFDEDIESDVPDEDGPTVAQASSSKPKSNPVLSKSTAIVEQSNALETAGDELKVDDLDWLNEEDDYDVDMDTLFPKGAELETEFALEDGTVSGNLAIGDAGMKLGPDHTEERKEHLNAFEAGLERLKRKRAAKEMTAQEAENLMEDLICKMTTAADEDAEIMRKNMAKDRLAVMCDKAQHAMKKKLPYLGKKEHNSRFQRLYKHAKFPQGKLTMLSFFEEGDKFNPTKALKGTRDLLKKYPVQPAVAKVTIMKYCIGEMNKPTNADWFVTFGGLSVVRTWLMPNPDGSLPALSLRNALLRVLEKLPVTTSTLKKSQVGVVLKEYVRRDDETLQNRKLCQDLINKWLSIVLDQETSMRRHRAQVQHEMSEGVEQVTKKRKTKAQIEADNKEIQERRHPQMFQKPSHNFVVQPQYDVKSKARTHKDESRKGKVSKLAGELRAHRPAAKHEHVKISANGIHLDF